MVFGKLNYEYRNINFFCFPCRVVWIILLLSFSCFFGFTLFYRCLKLRSHPVSSRLQVIDTREVDYPAVTFCNMNQIKKSYVMQDPFIYNVFLAQEYLKEESNLSISDPQVIEKMDTEYSMRQITKDGAFTAAEMLYDCVNGTTYYHNDCTFYLRPVLTSLGYCYTFNSPDYIKEHGRVKTSKTGTKYGISFFINVSQYEYFVQVGVSAGIRVKENTLLCLQQC